MDVHVPVRSPAELQARLAAERAMTPFLLYRDGGGAQRLVTLPATDAAVLVGRACGLDVVLDWDPEVSRVHAVLDRLGGTWTVVDDGLSRNGTFVNTLRVVGRRRLIDGDLIRCGAVTIEFRDPATAGGVETRRTAGAAAAAVSPAQRRVLIALCRPLRDGSRALPATNKHIAAELTLSVDAVKSHLRRICETLEIPDMPQNRKRVELAWTAISSGLVTPRDLVSDPEP